MATKSRLAAYASGVKKLNEKQNTKANVKKTSVLTTLAKEKTKKEEN